MVNWVMSQNARAVPYVILSLLFAKVGHNEHVAKPSQKRPVPPPDLMISLNKEQTATLDKTAPNSTTILAAVSHCKTHEPTVNSGLRHRALEQPKGGK